MNNKGQALVEFIIILPVFILIMLVVFDYARIMQTKIELESVMEDVTTNDNYNLDKNIVLSTKNNNEYIDYTLTKNVKLTSPILVVILDKDYKVQTKRSIHE